MQARIKKDDIIAFKQYASNIVKDDSKRMPVLSFLKVEVAGDYCSIIKTNLKAFALHTCVNDSQDCSFLVDENILFNFVELSESEYINFTISGIKITISDGRNTTVSPTENVNMYPFIDFDLKDEGKLIPQNAIDAIKICAEIVFGDEISGIMNSVFVGKGSVASSDGSVGYWQTFAEDLPTIVLRKDVAMNVGKMKACEYYQSDSYDLFKSGQTLLGFSKSEVQFVELPPKFEAATRDKISFYINKSSLIKWNNFCLNSAKSKVLSATFNANGYRLDLELVDSKYEFNTNYHLDIVDGVGGFKFNPATMNQILKVLPSEQICFYSGFNKATNMNDRYYLTDASNSFMAAIMLIN